jgi:hypothetical protein
MKNRTRDVRPVSRIERLPERRAARLLRWQQIARQLDRFSAFSRAHTATRTHL